MLPLSLQEKEQFGDILKYLADAVDLTEAQYQIAIDRYTTVGEFLSSAGSLLKQFNPTIKSQGSIRTGTATRPVHPEKEFDVDLTCLLQVSPPVVQKYLKDLVGKQLKTSETYGSMMEEMRRCWRIKYAESSRFHLDIVPGIPDTFQWLLDQNVPLKYAQHAVNITDMQNSNYEITATDLTKSNPEGYALWFLDIMKIEADMIREQLRKTLLLERVEDVPDYKVRTPLQRGVQLMKRHRDIMFEDDEDCPISIIISTLAAKAYQYVMMNNPGTIFYDVVLRMVTAMPSFIEKKNGISWIANPVNPKENFADKWQLKRVKKENFYKWHTAFLATLQSNKIQKGMESVGEHLKENFGTRSVNEAMNNIGINSKILRERNLLKTASSGIIGAVGTPIANHNFHGNR